MTRFLKRMLPALFLFLEVCVLAQEVFIPDAALMQAVRNSLQLPTDQPLTAQDMLALETLNGRDLGISDLTGLEHAENLQTLALPANQISDISPLKNMKRLESLNLGDCQISDISPLENVDNLRWLALPGNNISDISVLKNMKNLKVLYLWVNPILDILPLASLSQMEHLDLGACHQISDISPLAGLTQLLSLNICCNKVENISPLANLTQLKYLNLRGCRISDISPLANLTQLIELRLNDNRISDVNPLANLTMLEVLQIQNNRITDFSPLDGMNLKQFERDECCEFPRLSIQERMQSRNFPSVFAAWGGVLNRSDLSDREHMALHDLYFCCLMFGGSFINTPDGTRISGNMQAAQKSRDAFLALNPNMIFLVEIRIRDAFRSSHPDDWPYWIRDGENNIVSGWPGTGLVDFTNPEFQDIIVNQAVAVSKCGLYDGIFFDWWTEHNAVLVDHRVSWAEGWRGFEAEQRARDNIVQQIRSQVGDDFLIMVNTNRNKIPRTSPYINGAFMETGTDYPGGYSYKGLQQIEETLLWSEENMREPRINGLEGWAVVDEPLDGPTNRRWMRAITTLSLTHSDGYILFNSGRDHDHYWYDFWDVDLGRPVGKKAQLYDVNIDGLFIREFTNGWAVYNRSGAPQSIQLPVPAVGAESRLRLAAHVIPDLDGEIYLKNAVSVVINGPKDIVSAPFDAIIEFNEEVVGFEETDLKIENGAITRFEGSGSIYTATIAPTATGILTITIPPNAVQNAAGYSNIASTPYTAAAHIDLADPHSRSVLSAAFHPNGASVASGGADDTIRIWNAVVRQPVIEAAGHEGYVYSIGYSPDGTRFASGSADDTIRIWNAETGAHVRTLEDHTGDVYAVDYSPDGSAIVSGSGDRTVRLWNAETGKLLKTMTQHAGTVRTAAFSPDGALIASGGADRTVRLWNAKTGKPIAAMKEHGRTIYSVAFSPDGTVLASGSADKTIRFWDISSQSLIHTRTVGGAAGLVFSVAFSPDGSTLASGNQDGTVHLWASGNGRHKGTLEGHAGTVYAVAYSPDSQALVSGSRDRTLRFWSLPTPNLDVNGDGVVDIADLAHVAANYGDPGDSGADVNGDGVVDITDVLLVVDALVGQAAAAPALASLREAPSVPQISVWLRDADLLFVRSDSAKRGIAVLEGMLLSARPVVVKSALLPNYPNPFNPETWIPFELAEASRVRMTIYNASGQTVRVLDLGLLPAGAYRSRSKAAHWDGRNALGERAASGVYYVRIEAGSFMALRRMVVLK